MIYLTRRERFNSAHRLFCPELTDQENYEIYGKCSNPNWHGHNYELFVTVKGEVDAKLGYAANLSSISKIIKEQVIEKVDHKNLNLEVDFLKDMVTSTENLAISIWRELEDHIKILGVDLHCVKVVETENNYVEYYG